MTGTSTQPAMMENSTPTAGSGNRSKWLGRYGFCCTRGGAHSSRTIMLDELTTLLSYVNASTATKHDYCDAITQANCLGKRSGKTRRLTYRHLVDLYSLDTSHTLFRALLFFWDRDKPGRPLLALLCGYARDSILRTAAPCILNTSPGTVIARQTLETFIDDLSPGRFSPATLKSTAQNVNSSLTKSGHLAGRARKTRTRATATPSSAAYALLLGYLTGARGQGLLETKYTKLLDCSPETTLELAERASRKGWMKLKRIGDVIEVQFPKLITLQEREWLREQG